MKKYECKTIELPFKFGFFKQGTPDIAEALNAEGTEGWRLHQMVLPASSNMGQSEKMIAILNENRDPATIGNFIFKGIQKLEMRTLDCMDRNVWRISIL